MARRENKSEKKPEQPKRGAPVKPTKPWNSKQRRIWRRREDKRGGHTIRCAKEHGGNLCTCKHKANREAGVRENASTVELHPNDRAALMRRGFRKR